MRLFYFIVVVFLFIGRLEAADNTYDGVIEDGTSSIGDYDVLIEEET